MSLYSTNPFNMRQWYSVHGLGGDYDNQDTMHCTYRTPFSAVRSCNQETGRWVYDCDQQRIGSSKGCHQCSYAGRWIKDRTGQCLDPLPETSQLWH